MNIYTAEQIRAWDAYTIKHEPVASVDLMERAAQKCVHWLLHQKLPLAGYYVFCGKGNNGGDGLAIARMLFLQGLEVKVFILEFGRMGSADFQINLQRLRELPLALCFISSQEQFPSLPNGCTVIDALWGSGLHKPLEGLSALLVQHINQSHAPVVSVDVPSGMFLDASSKSNTVIQAAYTLTFQTTKLALLIAENAPFIGEVQVLDIGLHPEYLQEQSSAYRLMDEAMLYHLFRPRQRFAHKGNFGHALIMGGAYGKIGAALLAAQSCLHTGAGLTTVYLPRCGYTVVQSSLPEVMAITDENENMLTALPQGIKKFSVIGVGPGIGTADPTKKMIKNLIKTYDKPLVVDADALNCVALYKKLVTELPPHSVLTPHPKEFERLFGEQENDVERIRTAQQKAQELQCVVVLKGHHTAVALPDATVYFNSTGNAGMAKGGSGDVLTGIITALLAQGYTSHEAALMGVYLHGLAGDLAAQKLGMEFMTATDIISFLSQAFLKVSKAKK